MSEQDLSGKVGLDLTDFKAGITALNRELRVVESGFRASAASLGDWGKSADGLEMRMKALTTSMDLQKQKVDNLKQQHQLMVDAYGADSIAAQKLEIEVNKATEQFNKMDLEMSQAEKELTKLGQESDTTGNKVEDLGNKSKTTSSLMEGLKTVMAGLGEIVKVSVMAIAALAAAIVAVGVAVTGLVVSASKAAGELTDLSVKTGISTTRLQEMNYIANQLGVSQDTLTGAFAKLTRSISAGASNFDDYNKKVLELKKAGKDISGAVLGDMGVAFQKLGVKLKKSNGQFRDSEEVFNDVIKALGKIPNETERDAISMQIFGKSAMELNPIIKAGTKELIRLGQEAHTMGAVVSEEGVAALATFDDKMESLKSGLGGIGMRIASVVVPAFNDLITKLNTFLSSKEVQKFIDDFAASLKNLTDKAIELLNNVNWQGIYNAFNNVKLILSDFSKGDWIKGIADTRIALTGLVPQETLDKLQDITIKIGRIFGAINTGENTKPVDDLLSTLGGMISTWASTVDWKGLVDGFVAKQIELTNSITTWGNDPNTQSAFNNAGQIVGTALAGGIKVIFGGVFADLDAQSKQGGIIAGAGLVETWAQIGANWGKGAIEGVINGFTGGNISQTLQTYFTTQFGQMKGEMLSQSLSENFTRWILDGISTINPALFVIELAKKFKEMIDTLSVELPALGKMMDGIGKQQSDGYIQSIKGNMPGIQSAGAEMTKTLASGAGSDLSSVLLIGQQTATTYISGMNFNPGALIQAGRQTTQTVITGVNDRQKDASDSGAQTAESIASGVYENTGSATLAGQGVAGAILEGASSATWEAQSIGAAISDNIYQGLCNTWENLKANAGNKVQELIDSIRRQLNIAEDAANAGASNALGDLAGSMAGASNSNYNAGGNYTNQNENYAFYAPVVFQNSQSSISASIKRRRF